MERYVGETKNEENYNERVLVNWKGKKIEYIYVCFPTNIKKI